jgi:hypothetical protein
MKPTWASPKFSYHSYTFDELQETTFEERLAIVRETGKKAKSDFTIKYRNVNNWFNTDYDQLYVLSFCMAHFLLQAIGHDEEAETGSLSFAPHYLEILQAIALSHERIYSARPLWNDIDILRDSMKEIGTLIQIKLLDFPENIKSLDEFYAHKLRTDVIGYHLAVRNWAYLPQMKQVGEDMAYTIQKEFTAIFGIDPVAFIRLMFALCNEMECRVNTHMQKIASALRNDDYIKIQEAYEEAFGAEISSKAQIDKLWEMCHRDIELFRILLISHSDLRLSRLFTFTTDEMIDLSNSQLSKSALTSVLDKLSFRFGELKDHQQEYIILDNPVHEKPFIKLSQGEYFTSIWTTIPHLTLALLENFLKDNDALREKYNSQRAKYLEDQVELLFRKSFPNAKIFRGSKWTDASGKQFENDLLVVIDSFALIVESKSGMVTKPAKRGAPDRLAKTLRELVEEPSEQALRFVERLKAGKGLNVFDTQNGTKNVIDVNAVNYFIPLGVTFYHLGIIGANLKQLIAAGFTNKVIYELAPSISLTDLQIVFELLDTEAQKIHYLQRRREFETQVQYIADELDLLGFYLDTGFNIGDMDNEPDLVLDISLKSKKLDPYFLAKAEGENIEKPSHKMTKWWKAILNRLEEKKASRWLELSFVLLNMNIGAQEEFEEKFLELAQKVKIKDVTQKHNWVAFWTAKEERRYIVVGYPYLDEHRDERNSMINTIVTTELEKNPKAKGIAVIGVNVEKAHNPYSVLVGYLSVNLFDDLFSN